MMCMYGGVKYISILIDYSTFFNGVFCWEIDIYNFENDDSDIYLAG